MGMHAAQPPRPSLCRTAASTAREHVVVERGDARPGGHDILSKSVIAQGLAPLLGGRFAGLFDPLARPSGPIYFVPFDTLTTVQAQLLGIHDARDLFGGVVPSAFMASKLIAHPLLDGSVHAPSGWQRPFAAAVDTAVLPGFSVFDADDAWRAGQRLLESGTLRLKDPAARGGVGQSVVDSEDVLRERLAGFIATGRMGQGLVLERNLENAVTHSVGQVRVGGLLASYRGSQRLVRNNQGIEVYGGSDLHVVRGDFDRLLREPLPDPVRLAVEQALLFHRTALRLFKGLFVSRCNYDVAQGLDWQGRWRSGVLEQSWRIGGASGAEVAALQVLQANPGRRCVQASTHEVYGGVQAVPHGAWTLFDGDDEEVGRLTKYVLLGGGPDD